MKSGTIRALGQKVAVVTFLKPRRLATAILKDAGLPKAF